MTRQFFEAGGPQGNFYEKKQKKNSFQIWSRGVCIPNFRPVSFFVWSGSRVNTDTMFLKKGQLAVFTLEILEHGNDFRQ